VGSKFSQSQLAQSGCSFGICNAFLNERHGLTASFVVGCGALEAKSGEAGRHKTYRNYRENSVLDQEEHVALYNGRSYLTRLANYVLEPCLGSQRHFSGEKFSI